MTEQNQLSLEEMISLAQKVDEWVSPGPKTYCGVVERTGIIVEPGKIRVLYKNVEIGKGQVSVAHDDVRLHDLYAQAEKSYQERTKRLREEGIQKVRKAIKS